MAHLQGERARHDLRFDGLDWRLDRIERRLDLVDSLPGASGLARLSAVASGADSAFGSG